MINKKKFLQRFAKDYNLPINVFDEKMFDYYKDLYGDFFPNCIFDEIVEKIENEYGGNVDQWLDYCASVRDNAINEILSSPEYNHFNTMSMTSFDVTYPCGERSCYTEEADGEFFLSIDLKKANFQALKYVKVITDDTYEKFIKRMGGDDYITGSKYLRQVIFGKLNPSRQIKVEKYLMCKVYDGVNNKLKNYGFDLYSFNSDEIVYKASKKVYDNISYNTVDGFKTSIQHLIEDLKHIIDVYVGVDTTIEFFNIKRLPIVNSNESKVDAYVKQNFITKQSKLKKASTTFFPQIYKLWIGKPINEKDRVFFFENQLATFNESLKLIE
jgi:hypothetical protein